jgi:hypothetical protein
MYLLGDVSGNWGTANAASVSTANIDYRIDDNAVFLQIAGDQPFVSVEIEFDHSVVSASAPGFNFVTNGNKIAFYRVDEIEQTELQVEFAYDDNPIRINALMLDEQSFMSDIVIPNPVGEPPVVAQRQLFMPVMVR